jgi:hypothetical protein
MFLLYTRFYHGFRSSKKSCEPRDTDQLRIAQLKMKLLKKLDDKMWITDIHYIATFLHPETKSLLVSNIY